MGEKMARERIEGETTSREGDVKEHPLRFFYD